MFGLNTWDILAFVGFIFLVLFFYAGKNLVWGAFSLGIIAALIVCVIYFIKYDEWPWDLFKKIIIVITFIGIFIESGMRLANVLKKNKS